MQRLVKVMRRLVTSALVIWLVSLAAPCRAQDAPDTTEGRGPVFVPGGFLGFFAPVGDRVALNVYGFYYGAVDAPVAQVDVPIRVAKFLTVTPSYLYYDVPPSGLEKAAAFPIRFTDHLEENQFRVDGTVRFAVHGFEISDRNMYVRRFLSAGDIDRYRQRISVAHPIAVGSRVWNPFVSYEAFYERSNGGWNRSRVMAGATVPLAKHVAFQPSYVRDNYRTRGVRDINYLQFGLIVTRK